MKKVLLSLALGAVTLSASAISPFLEFQPVIAGDHMVMFNVQGGIKASVHPHFSVGAGLGVTEKWNFDSAPLIPIFARGQFETSIGKFKPFVSLDLGYEINTAAIDCGAVLVNPMIGLSFGKWYGGIGYLAHCWTPSGSGATSCFNMKIGYTF